MRTQLNFTLSHLNEETVRIFLNETGWSNLLDYEIYGGNSLYTLYWENDTFTSEDRPETLLELSKLGYYGRFIPLVYLRYSVQDSLHEQYTSTLGFRNFDDYYMTRHRSLPSLLVFVPYKYPTLIANEPQSPKKVEEIDDTLSMVQLPSLSNLEPVAQLTSVEKVNKETISLSGWIYFLNPSTKKSYILQNINGTMYEDQESWQVFGEGTTPIHYRKKYEGYVVSRKYKDRLRELGAKYSRSAYRSSL